MTYAMIRQVLDKLKTDKPKLAPLRVWQAYAQLDDYKGQPINELTALVALIRRVCGIDATLTNYDDTVRRNFQNWILKRHSGGGEKFNEEQMDWLRMIRDHVAVSIHMERDDLDMAPFDGQGGLGKLHQLFGGRTGGLYRRRAQSSHRPKAHPRIEADTTGGPLRRACIHRLQRSLAPAHAHIRRGR